MSQEVESLNIYQKLACIRKVVEVIKKNKSGYGYKYVSDDELLAKVTAGMYKYHLSLIPEVVPNSTVVSPYHYLKTKTTKGTKDEPPHVYEEHNNEVLVSSDMVYRWINNDDPSETVAVPWAMVGQQTDASQALGSGLTYSMRYFLLKYFNIATPEDDPDNWRKKQKEAADSEEKALLSQMLITLDDMVREYLETHPKDGAAVKELLSKYADKGDYRTIKEATRAAKAFNDFKNTFMKEEVE